MTNEELKEIIDKGFTGVHARLDRLNGSVQEHGEDIAVLQDRSDDMREEMRTQRSQGGWLGGAFGLIGSAFMLGVEAWFQHRK